MMLTQLVTKPLTEIRPAAREYVHASCHTRTLMASPRVTPNLWCCYCKAHFPLAEFRFTTSIAEIQV